MSSEHPRLHCEITWCKHSARFSVQLAEFSTPFLVCSDHVSRPLAMGTAKGQRLFEVTEVC